MKNIIQNYGWKCIDPNTLQKTFQWLKNFEILEDGVEWFESRLIMRLRENHEGATHLTIREYYTHTRDELEEPEKNYLFQGWLLEDTKEEFENLMKRLRI